MVASASSDRHNRFSPAVVIPVYNHERAIAATLESVLEHQLPVLLVDDGSDQQCRRLLLDLQRSHAQQVTVLRLDQNGGKGAAVKRGLRRLMNDGATHAIQVDADGQHDISALSELITQACANPRSLILSYPQYDRSVPKMRYYARYLTHVWVWINTLSIRVVDSMCGYRVYPLEQTLSLLDTSHCGDRMEFDTEIVVRWCWRGLDIVQTPTRVHYPRDGVSHFRVWRDNALISWMHTRLFFGMLIRMPRLLIRKLND